MLYLKIKLIFAEKITKLYKVQKDVTHGSTTYKPDYVVEINPL